MTIFDKIVMSQVEPSPNDLWMRDAVENIKNEDGSITHKHLGKSLWWFTPQGWKKLFDFDTRYSFEYEYDYDVSDIPFDVISSYDEKIGIHSSEGTFFLYDGSRSLESSSNLVTEGGLKKHVDEIKTEINKMQKSLSKIEGRVSDNEIKLDTLETKIDNIEDKIESIESDFSELVSSFDEKLEYLEQKINSLTP